ncbi:MAG: hypothetical protein ACRD3W_19830, partial [Terriglobales bacterium]
ESKFWKNHVDEFLKTTEKREAFVSKLERKAQWLKHNSIAAINALRSEGIVIEDEPEKVLTAFITFSPTPAASFVTDFPCVAVSELLADLANLNGHWPYTVGVYEIERELSVS